MKSPIDIDRIFIDRQMELDLFSQILSRKRQERILFISGKGGMGKTSLLRMFTNVCNESNILNATYSFRPATGSPIEVMLSFSRTLGSTRFAEFHETLTAINSQLSITAGEDDISSIQIQLALGGFNIEERKEHLSLATSAFFADLRTLLSETNSLVCLFDDFEMAGPVAQDWLSNSFLEYTHHTSGTISVVAGRQVPQPNQEWETSHIRYDLNSISRLDWQEYAQLLKIDLPSEMLTWLTKVYEGRPLEMTMAMTRSAREQAVE